MLVGLRIRTQHALGRHIDDPKRTSLGVHLTPFLSTRVSCYDPSSVSRVDGKHEVSLVLVGQAQVMGGTDTPQYAARQQDAMPGRGHSTRQEIG